MTIANTTFEDLDFLDSPTKDSNKISTPVWALGPNFSLTAARAAAQLDYLISKKASTVAAAELDAVEEMLSLLEGKTEGPPAQIQGKRTFSERISYGVLSGAMHSSKLPENLSSIEQLNKSVKSLAEALQKSEPNPEDSVIKGFRDFFVALSKHSSAQRKLIYGNVMEPAFRRLA